MYVHLPARPTLTPAEYEAHVAGINTEMARLKVWFTWWDIGAPVKGVLHVEGIPYEYDVSHFFDFRPDDLHAFLQDCPAPMTAFELAHRLETLQRWQRASEGG